MRPEDAIQAKEILKMFHIRVAEEVEAGGGGQKIVWEISGMNGDVDKFLASGAYDWQSGFIKTEFLKGIGCN